jgi:hypothetical protein
VVDLRLERVERLELLGPAITLCLEAWLRYPLYPSELLRRNDEATVFQ